MVMIIVSTVTICGHKIMFLAVCITVRGMRRLIPLLMYRGDFHNRGRTCGENRYRLVQTHGMEMLSIRERNMRVWKLKKKIDDKENELTNIKRKVKEGMDAERKKLDNRRTGF